jgi:protein-tyrosine phosphatase
MLNDEPQLGASLGGLYAAALRRLGPEIGAVVSELVEPGALPALVHCTAGKDRTGIVVALVLSSVGVADEVVAADYAVTAELLTPEFFAGVEPSLIPAGQVDLTPIYRADAPAMLEALDVVRDIAGGAGDYLVKYGVSVGGLGRLRDELVVPLP